MTTLTNFLNKYLETNTEFPSDFSKLINLEEKVSYQMSYATSSSSYPQKYDVNETVVESIINAIPEHKIKPLISAEWFINRNLQENISVFNQAFLRGKVDLAKDILEVYIKEIKEYDYFSMYKICENSLNNTAYLNNIYSQLDIESQNKARDLYSRVIELAYECREKTITFTDKRRKPKNLDLSQLLTTPINEIENSKKLFDLNIHLGEQLINIINYHEKKGLVFFDYLWNKLDENRKDALLKHEQAKCEKYHLFGYDYFSRQKDSLIETIVFRSQADIFEYLQNKGVSLLDTNLNEEKFLKHFQEEREKTVEYLVKNRSQKITNSVEQSDRNDFKNSNKLLELAEKDFHIIPKITLSFVHHVNLIYLNLLDESKLLTKYDENFSKAMKIEINDKFSSINNEQIKAFFVMKKEFVSLHKDELKEGLKNDSFSTRSAFDIHQGLNQIKGLDKINLKNKEKEELENTIFPHLIRLQFRNIRHEKMNTLIESFLFNWKMPITEKEIKNNENKTTLKI